MYPRICEKSILPFPQETASAETKGIPVSYNIGVVCGPSVIGIERQCNTLETLHPSGISPIHSMPLSFILRISSTILSVFCNQIVDDCTASNHHKFCFFKSDGAFGFTLGMANAAFIGSVAV